MSQLSKEEAVKRAESVQGWMSTEELGFLYDTARSFKQPIKWTELGVWRGRSLTAVVFALPPGSQLTAVDHFVGQENEPDTAVNRFIEALGSDVIMHDMIKHVDKLCNERPDISIEVIVGKTTFAATLIEDGSQDAVFIDSSHTEDDVAEDCLIWSKKLKKGGLLFGHDLAKSSVARGLAKSNVVAKKVAGSIWIRKAN